MAGMGTVLGLLALLVGAVVVAVVRLRSRDEVFDGITPGLLPAPGQPSRRVRVARSGQPPIAVRFTPPDGVTPGLVGTVIDNEVNHADISATLVDLAIRGWFRIRPLGRDQRQATAEARERRTKPDWELIRNDPAPTEPLSRAESVLVRGLFATSATTTLSAVRAGYGHVLREAIVELYRETVTRGWFRSHPRSHPKGWLVLGVVLGLTGLAAAVGPLLAGATDLAFLGFGLLASGILIAVGTRVPTPTTAEGSVVRVQSLGFREYIATAEAGQLAADAALDVYTRYLPYAMVFGVVDHWNRVVADAIRISDGSLLDAALFGWILDSGDLALLGLDILPDLADLGDLGDFDLSGLLDGITDGAGDFASSVGDALGGLGDGCDLLDGCGCDF
jgi:hypothetical protein